MTHGSHFFVLPSLLACPALAFCSETTTKDDEDGNDTIESTTSVDASVW